MILSNYWKWLNAILTTNPTSTEYYDPASDIGLKDLNGATTYISLSSSDATRRYRVRNINDGSVRVGNGNGEITADDYAMSGDITDNISNLNYSINSAGTDEGLNRTIAISGINNTANNITITEVGYCKYIEAEQHDSAQVLFAKVQLSEPVLVAAGGNFLINLSWIEA